MLSQLKKWVGVSREIRKDYSKQRGKHMQRPRGKTENGPFSNFKHFNMAVVYSTRGVMSRAEAREVKK